MKFLLKIALTLFIVPLASTNGVTAKFDVTAYGANGSDKVDDTIGINKAIKAACKGCTVSVPNGVFLVSDTINLKSNMTLQLDKNAVIRKLGTANDSYAVLMLKKISNVTVTGGTVEGDRDTHIPRAIFDAEKTGNTIRVISKPSASIISGRITGHGLNEPWAMIGKQVSGIPGGIGEYSSRGTDVFKRTKIKQWTGEHGIDIAIYGSTNVNVENIYLTNSWGDGAYIGYGSKHIRLHGVSAQNNRRLGLAVTGASDVLVENSSFLTSNGTSPMCGIDIEPNSPVNNVDNVRILNNTFLSNTNCAISLHHSASVISDITIDSNIILWNGGGGLMVQWGSGYNFTNNVGQGIAKIY